MKKITLSLALTSFGFALIAHSQVKAPINLSAGQKYLVESKMNLTNTTEAMGQSIEVKMDATSLYNIEVKNKAENYNLSNTFTSMKMNMSAMGQETHFNSDSSEDMKGPIGQSLAGFINKPADIVMTDTGAIIHNEKDSSAAPASPTIAQMIKQLGITGYGATMAFQSLPAKLNVGTSWSDSNNIDGVTRNIVYTVSKIEGDIASVSVTGTASANVTREQQGMEIVIKTTGKITGDETVNIKTGVIQANNTLTEQSGTASVMGQDMPTSSKVTVNTTTKLL